MWGALSIYEQAKLAITQDMDCTSTSYSGYIAFKLNLQCAPWWEGIYIRDFVYHKARYNEPLARANCRAADGRSLSGYTWEREKWQAISKGIKVWFKSIISLLVDNFFKPHEGGGKPITLVDNAQIISTIWGHLGIVAAHCSLLLPRV